jgi:peptidoglycan/LPS O-acetylase OafA/YrhL
VPAFEHRPALDGTRAVAALLVILFHAGVPALGHGYVGVDVFFVLSGFLTAGCASSRSTRAGFGDSCPRRSSSSS